MVIFILAVKLEWFAYFLPGGCKVIVRDVPGVLDYSSN